MNGSTSTTFSFVKDSRDFSVHPKTHRSDINDSFGLDVFYVSYDFYYVGYSLMTLIIGKFYVNSVTTLD